MHIAEGHCATGPQPKMHVGPKPTHLEPEKAELGVHVSHLVGSASRKAAGLYFSVRGLAQELSEAGARVDAVALADEFSELDAEAWEPIEPHFLQARWPRGFGFSPMWVESLNSLQPEIVHVHGLWMFHSFAGRIYGKRAGRPYVLSPHGMLEPQALKVKAWKKLPVWLLWEKRAVRGAAVIHCTSQAEAKHVRERGFRQPLAVIPNGVGVPLIGKQGERSREERVVLFLSRIHPIKGLIGLIDAWALLKPNGWKLRIVGPDDYNYRRAVEHHARRAGVGGLIEFSGAVYGEEKWAAFRAADLFVLPSLSENFGNVVTEALVSGVPVVATTGTPWRGLAEQGCGWWVKPTPKTLAEALDAGMKLSDDERAAMGARGRAWAIQEFSWPKIAMDMLSVYEWVLGRGAMPGCVRLD